MPSYWRSARSFAHNLTQNPRILLDLGRAFFGSGRTPFTPPPEVHFSFDFQHHYGAEAVIGASCDEVFDLALDFDRFGEWFDLHTGWPGGAPTRQTIAVGAAFAETVRLLGTPARLDWTVTHYEPPRALALEGRGPMGTRAALWISVDPVDGGSRISVTGGFHSDALKGPMGSLVNNAAQTSTTKSIASFAALLSGHRGGPVAEPVSDIRSTGERLARPAAVRHSSGALVDPWAPVIVGVGQSINRPTNAGDVQSPIDLAVTAARAALADAGAAIEGRWGVGAVPTLSWTYGAHQAAILADELRIDAAEFVQSAPLGGDGPQRLINDVAELIRDGYLDAVVVSGAEAFASAGVADSLGMSPDWTRTSTGPRARSIGSEKPGSSSAEDAVGLMTPVYMYALMESAWRGRLGRSVDEHTAAIAQLWSRFSDVAARNPFAWITEPKSAAEIATTSASNRMLSSPYPKLMTANLTVDQGASVVLCSAAAAATAGIPDDRWVFLHAGAHAEEEWFVSNRHDLAAVPAIGAMGRAALEHAGVTIADVEHVDLYSCFPFAVQVAADELGIDIARQLTQTGGLTFAGGPLNNYSMHGVAALVETLRTAPGSYGIATALGWFATKHAIGVYSTQPPRQQFRDIDAGLRMNRPAARTVSDEYNGKALVEAYTTVHSPAGEPVAVILSALTDDGARVLARSERDDLIRASIEDDLLGATVVLGDDVSVSATATNTDEVRNVVRTTPAVTTPLRLEWDGPLCIITLDRPAVRNAIDLDLALRLEQAIDAFEADPTARVAILTGAGGDFCTGMDLKAAAHGQFPIAPKRGLLGIAAKPPAKPLIAAVEGYALAGGCELALAADLIVASKASSFGLPESKRGLVAAAGGVLRLAQRLPRNAVLEMTFTGEPVSAQRLYDLGVVNRVVKPGTALAAARELAARIAQNAPLSITLSKQIVDNAADWSADEAFDRQTEIATAASYSDDAAEGVRAFAEGRDPHWTGR